MKIKTKSESSRQGSPGRRQVASRRSAPVVGSFAFPCVGLLRAGLGGLSFPLRMLVSEHWDLTS